MKKLRFKVVLPLLFAFVLALGSCVTVCAADDLRYPDNYVKYDYEFVISDGSYYHFFSSSLPVYAVFSNGFVIFNLDKEASSYYYDGHTGRTYIDNLSFGPFYYNNSSQTNMTVICSSYNINFSDGSPFFRVPLARLAVPLKAEVLKQTKTILPVGVGCLALLIGSVVLLPRLRRSLLRL